MENNIKKYKALRQDVIKQLHNLHIIANTAIQNVNSRQLFELRCQAA